MKTFIIDIEFRINTHFYTQPESGRKIKLMFSNVQCYEHFKSMFSLDIFDILCIQSYTTRKIQHYNHYKNCKVLETGTIKPDLTLKGTNTYAQPYVLFQCEKIVMDIPKNDLIKIIRKEKLKNLSLC